jgi:hypothetical protein
MMPYVSVLYEIVSRGLNTNSYKFALWRALTALAPETDPDNPKLSKLDLASRFLEYYWPLETEYHLRQGTDPDRDPVAMVLIRKLMLEGTVTQGEKLADFAKRMPSAHKTLIDRIARQAFDDVIPRFHTVQGEEIAPPIFKYTGHAGRAGDVIELTTDSRQFLITYRKLIEYVATSGWVRFTERFTSAPRLHDKIGGTPPRRGALARWRAVLYEIQWEVLLRRAPRHDCGRGRSSTTLVVCLRRQDMEFRSRLPPVQQSKASAAGR